jgi:hypothetical protein
MRYFPDKPDEKLGHIKFNHVPEAPILRSTTVNILKMVHTRKLDRSASEG